MSVKQARHRLGAAARRNLHSDTRPRIDIGTRCYETFIGINGDEILRSSAIASTTDELILAYEKLGIFDKADFTSRTPWLGIVLDLQQVIEELHETVTGYEVDLNSSELHELMDEHFAQLPHHETDGAIRNAVAVTTISALSYCSYRLQFPHDATPLLAFRSEITVPNLVGA